MAGYVIGIGVLAFAAWQWWDGRAPAGGIEFTGTIVDEVDRKSTQTGRRTRVYAPRVAYQHPRTGRDEVYEPSSFGQTRFTAGETTALRYDPEKDTVSRPPDRPIRDTSILVLVGVGFVVAQLFAG